MPIKQEVKTEPVSDPKKSNEWGESAKLIQKVGKKAWDNIASYGERNAYGYYGDGEANPDRHYQLLPNGDLVRDGTILVDQLISGLAGAATPLVVDRINAILRGDNPETPQLLSL